ncbi:MAG: hypothetical protein E6X17_11535 [Sporomusaceae bacterium]|nr:hypothetical protein [Sporomusaceae bacterium]
MNKLTTALLSLAAAALPRLLFARRPKRLWFYASALAGLLAWAGSQCKHRPARKSRHNPSDEFEVAAASLSRLRNGNSGGHRPHAGGKENPGI